MLPQRRSEIDRKKVHKRFTKTTMHSCQFLYQVVSSIGPFSYFAIEKAVNILGTLIACTYGMAPTVEV